jgi:DNA-binding transcriptional LysR family regulator
MPPGHETLVDVHLRDLRAFLAVAEREHVTRAAEALHVAQPALSKQVRTLERQVGVQLFERAGRGVRLTAGGAALLPAAREVLEAWERARAELARAATGTLVVGMQTSPGRGLLPEVRRRVAERCPDAELVLRQVGWADPTGGLVERACDAAFVWLPLPPDAGLSWLTIAREPRWVLLPANHALAGHDELALADLENEPFLALPASAPAMRAFWLGADARDGAPPQVAAEIRDTEETYEAVAAGVGICLLAEGNVPIFRRRGVVAVPVTDIAPAELVLAWRRGERVGLLDHLATTCGEVVAEAAAT